MLHWSSICSSSQTSDKATKAYLYSIKLSAKTQTIYQGWKYLPGRNTIGFLTQWQRVNTLAYLSSGLYYKPVTIVNEDSRVANKLEASLTDDARVVIYNCHMFIVQATEL